MYVTPQKSNASAFLQTAIDVMNIMFKSKNKDINYMFYRNFQKDSEFLSDIKIL